MLFGIGDEVEARPLALRYRGERGRVTGHSKLGEVYVELRGMRNPVPFQREELALVRSADYAGAIRGAKRRKG
jgi:hypothetical protein